MTPEQLIRPEIQRLSAYPVADATGMVKLDAMENPYSLPASLRAELAQLAPVRAVLPAGAGTLPPAEFAALAGAAFDTAWVTGLVRYSAV